MIEADLIESLKVHQFEPGDRLIIYCPGRVSRDQQDRILHVLEHWAPGVKALVLEEGMTVDLLRGVPE